MEELLVSEFVLFGDEFLRDLKWTYLNFFFWKSVNPYKRKERVTQNPIFELLGDSETVQNKIQKLTRNA